MAVILNLETSTKNCSVSIAKNGKQLCLIEENEENYAHGEKLNQFVDWCIEGAEIEFKDLDAVCVSKGPGSYTGLRIGVSSAKGFAFGSDKVLLSVNTLDVLVDSQKGKKYDYIIPMLDARRMEVYTAVYDQQGKQLTTTEAKVIDEKSFEHLEGKKILFVGDGVEKCKETLAFLKATFIQDYPSAKNMISLSEEKYNQKLFEDIAYFEPYYLKDFIGEKMKNIIK